MNRDIPPSPLPSQTSATRCFIGLGSNLGDRAGYLRAAVDRLASTDGIAVCRASSVYESPPWGYLDQPTFLNAVVEIDTSLGPIQLLLSLHTIESRLGRERRVHWGPREIDLDLLLYGSQSVNRRGLTVPHPFAYERTFVLAPLNELAPELTGPAGEPIAATLRRLDPTGQQTIIQPIASLVDPRSR